MSEELEIGSCVMEKVYTLTSLELILRGEYSLISRLDIQFLGKSLSPFDTPQLLAVHLRETQFP